MRVAKRCDIYCRVVDNFGDIGVLWRLARQLGDEFGWRVRLVVDDLTAFHAIEPTINDKKPQQWCGKTEVFAWKCPPIGDFVDVVIEGFGCQLPQGVVGAIAAQHPKPHWLNLEYLSAENWVREHHLLPSQHPQLGMTKTFFFPGFVAGTGGLLRERVVQPPPPPLPMQAPLKVLLFAYDLPSSASVAKVLADSTRVAVVSVATGALAERLLAIRLPKLDVAAFVPQREFDALLSSFDFLLVRGEDSFIRAMWTGKPFVWQIYPQDDRAHWPKLEAFLDIYCVGLAAPAARSLRALWHLANGVQANPAASESPACLWEDYLRHLPEIAAHAHRWTTAQMKQPDLASNLLAWVEKSTKNP